MDAVYPLGNGSLMGNWEIEHSILLLRKFAPWIDCIWTIGKSAPWASNIPMNETQHPAVNIWEKVITACMDNRISDPFFLLSDDHFIIQPIEPDYPNYYAYPISEYPFKPGFGKFEHPYVKLVRRTQDILGDVLFYNVHCPVVIHKEMFISRFELFKDEIYSDCGMLVKTTYLAGQPGVQMDDYKTKMREPYESVVERCKGRHVFSTDHEVSEGAQKFILEILG